MAEEITKADIAACKPDHAAGAGIVAKAEAVGMTKAQIFFHVVLMQVVKRILPPMTNEIITLVKDTSLARVVMVVELIKAAQDIVATGLIWPLFYTAVFYLLAVGILTLVLGTAEKKLDYYKG